MQSALSPCFALSRPALALCMCLLPLSVHAQGEPQVRVNQMGFPPQAPKIAVAAAEAGSEFVLIDRKTGKEVLRGELSDARKWDLAGETVRVADFSSVDQAGDYLLRVGTSEQSPPFRIGAGVYDEVLKAAIKAYYFNRNSAGLEPRFAGKFARPAGHPDTIVYIHEKAASAQRPTGTVVSAPKGWYDAGDYNKYIVNSGITMYTLLQALEHYGPVFKQLELNIPESGNALPDLLDEILWNLDWMEDMQDPHDGGVYHKLTTLRFVEPEMPHTQMVPRYMMPKTTAATLDFAAVMAQASRVLASYEDQLPGRSERYLKAATAAWAWAKQNPKVLYQQPEGVNTGTYARKNEDLKDEFVWAASELYAATGKKEYLKHVKLPKKVKVPDWGEVGALGLYTLAGAQKVPSKLQNQIREKLTQAASKVVEQWHDSGYQVPMIKEDFVWGSNAVAMNKAILLLQAQRYASGPNDYQEAARALLDYVLGRNPTGYSFVTGHGSKTPMAIHHRVSEADKVHEPVPGFLAGGPQPGWQDECKYPSRVPAKSYVDDWCSYSTNEVAINWNAPLVYVLAALR